MADDPFNIKLGRIFSPDGTGRFVSFANRVRRAANKSSRLSGGGVKKTSFSAEQYFSRRVIVKVSLVKMGKYGTDAQRHHLDYIGRDSAAPEGDKGVLYSRDENAMDAEAFHERGADDRHQFRIIVSPEDGKEMGDLRVFTRDLMRQMEMDLETQLDWAAANHYDTAKPHTHIVVRGIGDDGKNLIIPREYISYGMRDAAEDLLTRELGPITQINYAQKIALQIRQDRLTSLDRNLMSKMEDGVVNLKRSRLAEMDWQNRFESQRAKYLNGLGLAEKVGPNKWRLDDNLERTLRRLGERNDIIRTYQRALTQSRLERPIVQEPVYDPLALDRPIITGRVIKSGVFDDVNDRSFIVVDTLQGEAIFVETGAVANIETIERDMIIKVGPRKFEPKKSDYTIDKIAVRRGGTYSPSFHERSDPSAGEEYIKAHVRRLEALCRAGHVKRNSDGSWQLPNDYLERASDFEKKRGFNNPVKVDVLSQLPLKDMQRTVGNTWLDSELKPSDDADAYSGFGEAVNAAK